MAVCGRFVGTDGRHRIAVQSAEDHHRRASQAEREGVRILVDARTGQHVATSASNPGGCYHVTPTGCTCRGWTFRGLNNADVIALKADAARRHYLYGEALVNIHTDELIA